MKKLFLDTSFNSRYSYYEKVSDLELTKKNLQQKEDDFFQVLDNISAQWPEFKGDYQAVINPFAIIEYCGLGPLCKTVCTEKAEKFLKCFDSAKKVDEYIEQYSETPELVKKLDLLFNEILNNLNIFFNKEIDVQSIIDKANIKLKKYCCIENVIVIEEVVKSFIKTLKKEGKKHSNFKIVCGWFAWDVLLRYDQWSKIENNRIIVLKIMAGYYLGARKMDNAPGASLFGKIVGKKLFRDNEELLDAYLLEAGCMGVLPPDSSMRESTIILTADAELEKKIDSYIIGALILKNLVEITPGLTFRKFNFLPGYLIVVGRKDPNQKPNIINIENRIKKFELIFRLIAALRLMASTSSNN